MFPSHLAACVVLWTTYMAKCLSNLSSSTVCRVAPSFPVRWDCFASQTKKKSFIPAISWNFLIFSFPLIKSHTSCLLRYKECEMKLICPCVFFSPSFLSPLVCFLQVLLYIWWPLLVHCALWLRLTGTECLCHENHWLFLCLPPCVTTSAFTCFGNDLAFYFIFFHNNWTWNSLGRNAQGKACGAGDWILMTVFSSDQTWGAFMLRSSFCLTAVLISGALLSLCCPVGQD